MKLLKSIFPTKSKTDLINEKADTIVNELFISSLTINEISIIVELVRQISLERIQHEKKVILERLTELEQAEKFIKRV